MPISRLSLYGNPNIGAFLFATDKFALVPPDIPSKFAEEISTTLKVSICKTTICGSVLLGIFITGNSRGILVPHNAREEEVSLIESNVGVPVVQYNGKKNALGNMVLLNDSFAVVGVGADPELKTLLSKILEVEVYEGTIAGLSLPGVCAVVNNKAMLCHPQTTDEEARRLEEIFNIPVNISTVNCGYPYLRVGMLANSYGVVVGEATTGPEMAHIESSLGLIG
ncbi:MAG: translation initiation factor IF-6 [Candidatus Methanomethylicaceae archaeon]